MQITYYQGGDADWSDKPAADLDLHGQSVLEAVRTRSGFSGRSEGTSGGGAAGDGTRAVGARPIRTGCGRCSRLRDQGRWCATTCWRTPKGALLVRLRDPGRPSPGIEHPTVDQAHRGGARLARSPGESEHPPRRTHCIIRCHPAFAPPVHSAIRSPRASVEPISPSTSAERVMTPATLSIAEIQTFTEPPIAESLDHAAALGDPTVPLGAIAAKAALERRMQPVELVEAGAGSKAVELERGRVLSRDVVEARARTSGWSSSASTRRDGRAEGSGHPATMLGAKGVDTREPPPERRGPRCRLALRRIGKGAERRGIRPCGRWRPGAPSAPRRPRTPRCRPRTASGSLRR